LDVLHEAAGSQRVLVKDFKQVRTRGSLNVELIPVVGETLICGVRLTSSSPKN
jgi:hypothetical protein